MLNLEKYKPAWIKLKDINAENQEFRYRHRLNVEPLAQSMHEDGQKFPIVLWRREEDWSLQIVSGFRRFHAAQSLDWESILAIIVPESDMHYEEALKVNFIENIARKSLTDIDIVFACKKLKDNGKSNREIGRIMNKSERSVRRYLKVSGVPKEVQDAVGDGRITLKALDLLLTGEHVRRGAAPAKGSNNKDTADVSIVTELQKALHSGTYGKYIQEKVSEISGLIGDISQNKGHVEKIKKALKYQLNNHTNINNKSESIAHDRMYVKPTSGGGFDLVLKFRPKSDPIETAASFLERNAQKLRRLAKHATKAQDSTVTLSS